MHRLMRKVFLWFARNPCMRERLPQLPFMQKAVRRFMPGESIDDALGVAVELQAAGIRTMYTKLGENIADPAQAQAVADHYLELLAPHQGRRDRRRDQRQADAARPRPRRGHVPRAPADARRPPPRRRARTCGSTWRTAATSTGRSTCTSASARPTPRTGICLQAYLRRTARDVERLLPLGPAIRLVKGAYDEPAAVAFRSTQGGRRQLRRRSRSRSPARAGAARSASASARTTSS